MVIIRPVIRPYMTYLTLNIGLLSHISSSLLRLLWSSHIIIGREIKHASSLFGKTCVLGMRYIPLPWPGETIILVLGNNENGLFFHFQSHLFPLLFFHKEVQLFYASSFPPSSRGWEIACSALFPSFSFFLSLLSRGSAA